MGRKEAVAGDLANDELKRFKAKLSELPVREGYDNLPRGRLQKADDLDLSDLLVSHYTEGYAVEVAAAALGAINCQPQAERLRRVIRRDAASAPGMHFIDRHREQLILKTTNVEAVLDMLYGFILDDEQYQKISSSGTNPEKMRELYKLVPSWNDSCKDQLYKALKAKNRFLIDDLEGR
uniref:Apoptosis-associated speck-like protein containing a CARD n=1 Tax=Varanus komodoensis TaxID=61221 RepID=A0A8D2LNI5_VARKO